MTFEVVGMENNFWGSFPLHNFLDVVVSISSSDCEVRRGCDLEEWNDSLEPDKMIDLKDSGVEDIIGRANAF